MDSLPLELITHHVLRDDVFMRALLACTCVRFASALAEHKDAAAYDAYARSFWTRHLSPMLMQYLGPRLRAMYLSCSLPAMRNEDGRVATYSEASIRLSFAPALPAPLLPFLSAVTDMKEAEAVVKWARALQIHDCDRRYIILSGNIPLLEHLFPSPVYDDYFSLIRAFESGSCAMIRYIKARSPRLKLEGASELTLDTAKAVGSSLTVLPEWIEMWAACGPHHLPFAFPLLAQWKLCVDTMHLPGPSSTRHFLSRSAPCEANIEYAKSIGLL